MFNLLSSKLCNQSINGQICNKQRCPYYHLPIQNQDGSNQNLNPNQNDQTQQHNNNHNQNHNNGSTSNNTVNNSNGSSHDGSHNPQNFQNGSHHHPPPISDNSQILSLLAKLTQQVDLLTKESLERKNKILEQNKAVLQWNPVNPSVQ